MAKTIIKNLYKNYGEIEVLKDINLSISDKEFIVLVGPSGCGKSTLLRLIAGLETVTKGDIWIDDKLVNDVPPKSREIAMVFQDYALYPHLTVKENLSFGLKLRNIPTVEIEKRINDAAQILQIRHLMDRRPRQLSGGQRQRVAIGRTIVRHPKLFLFDEPLSNLDAKLRNEMRIEIAKLHNRLGNTIVYVTHDQTEAMSLGTRIVVMNTGVIQQVGTPIEVYNNPVNMFVASFIGSPAMNFIKTSINSKCVIMGIRPNNLYLQNKNGRKFLGKANVDIVESLGAEKNLICDVENTKVLMSVSPYEQISVNDTIDIYMDDNIYNFDPTTGERICTDKAMPPKNTAIKSVSIIRNEISCTSSTE